MSNPFHPDTPHYAAWERIRTLRISPDVGDINLRELIEEAMIAAEDSITKSISGRVREQTLKALSLRYSKVLEEAEVISSRMKRLVQLLDQPIEEEDDE